MFLKIFDKANLRMWVIAAGILVLFGILIYNLGGLTLAQGSDLDNISQDQTSRNIVLKGERGKILDTNGQPLAYNQKSYNVVFIRKDIEKRTEEYRPIYTEIMTKTIEIIEKNGGKTIDTFNIIKNESGQFEFYFGDISEEAAKKRETNWRKNMRVNEKLTPQEIYNDLRLRFYISDDVQYDAAFKLLSMWQEVQLSSYRSYQPITVAYNVSPQTVAEIENRSIELDGMYVTEDTIRIYPKSETAAHVVGYMGKITNPDEAIRLRDELGYSIDDKIGVEGIEKSMEQYLTSNTADKKGRRTVEVSLKGETVRVLETLLPKDGNDVVLTLDLELQQVLEEALKKNIEEINVFQKELLAANEETYKKIRSDISKINMAETGSAVVMEINTGRVLAIANYPSYDVNAFSTGISKADLDKLLTDPKLPLFNRAIASTLAPGSIFKLATGYAGLVEGEITIEEEIDDKGPYVEHTGGSTVGAPRCWNRNYHQHNNQNIVAAIKNSCNYYFFTVADRIGINKLVKHASDLGLDSLTNIELPGESRGQIGGQKALYDNTKPANEQKTSMALLVQRNIIKSLKGFLNEMKMPVDEEAVKKCSERLLMLVVEDNITIGNDVRVIMREELGIPEGVSNTRGWFRTITDQLSEMRWNPNQTIRTGMGQGISQVTPIAAARFLSALINGGTVYDAHIVERIIDENGKTVKEFEPTVFKELNMPADIAAAIKEGMGAVVSQQDGGGTAAKKFLGFEYINEIGGKTGSAQISNASNIVDIENTSWFAAFVPREKPEIAIIVSIQYGYSGSMSASTIKDTVQFYMDRKNAVAKENMVSGNELVP